MEKERPTPQTYGELQTAFDHFNATLFDGKLPPCLLTLQREKKVMGYFSCRRFVSADGSETVDEIALNPVYFGDKNGLPHQETIQTIVHEMCHLWQFHFGKPGRGRYHNKEWADKMESIGLMPSTTGGPGGQRTGDSVADYAIDGGRFLDAVKSLLTTDFCISWKDRFIPLGSPAAVAALVGGGDQIQEEVSATNSRAKRKYTCPECGANVWGKPNLHIVCGPCEVDFQES